MDSPEDRDTGQVDSNVARLIQAAYGEETLLDAPLKDRTRRLLFQAQRFRRSAPEFPDRAVAALGVVFASTAIWLVMQVAGAGIEQAWSLPGLLVALPLSANLALVPTAAVVVLRGRRRDD
jgi:hypothetical protein